MFAGGVFFFPLAAMVVAVFHTPRSVIVITVLTLLGISLTAYGFESGAHHLQQDIDRLYNSLGTWTTYLISIGFAVVVISTTVLVYKQAMEQLVLTVTRQRDEPEHALQR